MALGRHLKRAVMVALSAMLALNAMVSFGVPAADAAETEAETRVIKIATDFNKKTLVLKADGTVDGWGYVPEIPKDLTDPEKAHVIDIATGNSFALALRADGTVMAWSSNDYGQLNVPTDLTNPATAKVVAIAAGAQHALALRADGTVVYWGNIEEHWIPMPSDLTEVVAIAAGGYSSLALKADGTVMAWGSNDYGQLNVPTDLTNSAKAKVVAIAAGDEHALALRADGTVMAWGSNDYSQLNVPTDLTNSAKAKVVAIAAGGYISMALKADGTIVAWGKFGVLLSPVRVPVGLSGVTAMAGNYHEVLVLKADGTVFSWNSSAVNNDGIPEDLAGTLDTPPKVIAVAGSDHTLALKSDGTMEAWGEDINNRLNMPEEAGVKAVSAGWYHSLALKADGTVKAWGDSSQGKTTVPDVLTEAETAHVKEIAAGRNYSLALGADGTVEKWGGTETQLDVPSSLIEPVKAIAAGNNYALALKADGDVFAWGNNGDNQLDLPAGLSDVKAIAAGEYHALALKADGTVAAWGYNRSGQTTVPEDLKNPATANVKAIAAGYDFSMALKADGTVVIWGAFKYEKDKNPDLPSVYLPPGLRGVKAIEAGQRHALALRADGTIISWGSNEYKQAYGSYGLTNLSVTEGIMSPAFSPEITEYDVYLPAEVDTLHVEATLADPDDSILYINNQQQSSGTVAEIDITGEAPVVEVRAEASTGILSVSYIINVKKDGEGPEIQFDSNGNETPAKTAATMVHVTDAGAGVADDSLEYAWSPSETIPDLGWQSFDSGDTLTMTGEDGKWYLHVRARDKLGNVSIARTDAFVLDNTPPAVSFETDGNAAPAQKAESKVSVTDAGGIVLLEHAWSQSTEPPDSGWEAFTNGETLKKESGDGEWYLHIRATDKAGNVKETHSKAFVLDNTKPSISFGTSGNPAAAKSARTTVSVTDAGGLDTLEFVWSQSDAAPAEGWSAFVNGSELVWDTGDGEWYLYIRATDKAGNVAVERTDAFLLDNTAPVITLNGSNPMYVPHRGTYSEPGATALDGTDDLTGDIRITGTVDTETIGHYTIDYEVTDSAGNTALVTRDVYVYDGDAPAIYLNGPNPLTVEAGSIFVDPGATAWDKQDGDISGDIQVSGSVDTSILGTYTLFYNVSDEAGNAAVTVTRTVYVKDTTPPVITLIGDNPLRLKAGSPFHDPGAQAADTFEGDLTGAIVVSGTVDTSAPGTYTLSYDVSDRSGNAAVTVTRTVIVVAPPPSSDPPGPSPNPSPSPSPISSPETSPSSGEEGETAISRFINLNGTTIHPSAIDPSRPSVTLDAEPKGKAAFIEIPAALLEEYAGQNAEFVIEFKTPYGLFRIPVRLAQLVPDLADWLDEIQLAAGDISFRLILTDKTDDPGIRAALAESLPNGSVLGAMVDFRLEAVDARTGQTIGTLERFSEPLVRMIPMPEGLSAMPEQWGAFRYNENTGRFEFVPARTAKVGDVLLVIIRSASNSAYLVVHHPVRFTDAENHWGRRYIGLAAAKGLVAGIGGGRYDPDHAVTRAELAAMLVRAYGYDEAAKETAPYADVRQGDWYYEAAAAAKALGLFDFVGGSRLEPDRPLTREEMASMLAALITRENVPVNADAVNLNRYLDMGSADAAHLEAIRTVIGLQIMTGTGADKFSPKEPVTRAQAAVVLIRTLQALDWIDPQ